MDFITMTSADPRFQPLMGRLLTRRSIAAELDALDGVRDLAAKRWWLAVAEPAALRRLWPWARPRVVGFCGAIEEPGGEVVFENFWVHPRYRGRGVGRALFAARLDHYEGRTVRGWCSRSSRPLYRRHGFTEVDHGTSDTGHLWWEVRRSA